MQRGPLLLRRLLEPTRPSPLPQVPPAAAAGQAGGVRVIHNICFGSDEAGHSLVRSEAGLARAERAAEAGAIEAVVAAMRAHPHEAAVQEIGCITLIELCGGQVPRTLPSVR